MDVQCERCKTEYEFDDALVSGRGTTVRCTTCGHQFKVRRRETSGSDAAGDRWLVKTGSGQQFTFLTLRELQRAILAHQVSRGDLLRRAGAPPRPLGSISELEPFFEGRTSSSRPPARASSAAFAPSVPTDPAAVPVAFPKRSSITWEDDAPTVQPRETASYGQAPPPPMRRPIDTLRPTDVHTDADVLSSGPPLSDGAVIQPQPIVSTPYPTSAAPSGGGQPWQKAPSLPAGSYAQGPSTAPPPQQPFAQPQPQPPPAPRNVLSSPLPPPTRPVRREAPSGDYDLPDLPDMRVPAPSSFEEPYSVRRGRRVGGWVVALVLLLAVGVLGWALARPYLVARTASVSAQLDPRAEAFLTDGEKAMTDGNLDQAQESFDKASALAETDPRVRLDEARIAAARADVPWLRLKILPPTATDDLRATKAESTERTARAISLADAALGSAPDSSGAYRAKIDALRLAGQQDTARSFVTKVIAQASQPETAYVLAALDLAEPEPLWTTLIDRLRLAAAGEGNAGRARAALVYALAKSGDVAGAKSELGKLDALPRSYPLSPSLHAFLDRAPSKATLDGGIETSSQRTPVAAAAGPATPAPPTPQPATGAPAPAAPAGDTVPGDPRSAMSIATQAYRKGDFSRARQIYEAILTRNPGDSEAVAALGDVARGEGDTRGAISNYKRAISINPSYLPALLGLADTEWQSGDHAGAAKGYADIVDRFPDGTYPSYVKTRIDSAAPAGAETAKAPSDPTPASTDESSP